MKIEIRESSGSVQGIDEAAKTAHIRLVTYDVVDTYGSNWQRGVFDESLATRHIPAVWSHDKTQIFGSVREHDIQSTHVDVSVAFADLDAVPLARTAYSLMKDGHVVDTSFGFARVANGTVSRRDDPKFVPSRPGERERMVKADLIEVSPVLKGAVPGSQVLAVRSADGDQLSLTELEIFQAVAEGRIDVREALRVLEECEPMIVDKDPTTPVTATNVTATGVSGSREVIDLSRLIARTRPARLPLDQRRRQRMRGLRRPAGRQGAHHHPGRRHRAGRHPGAQRGRARAHPGRRRGGRHGPRAARR
jgi:HK97 family phage prohead protease